jgi:dTDP-4-dehydrorhamnose 3,5-epimerase
MEKMKKISTDIPGVFLVETMVFRDSRGFFLESYNRREMEKIGITDEFVQDNHSCSSKGVIRGLHYQSRHPQGKLIRVLRGSIFDVIVDLRTRSPAYGRSTTVEISAKNHLMIWVPVGCAHGFLALRDHTELQYKTTDFYYPEYDAGIRWNDPALGIAWPLEQYGISSVLVNDKDSRLPLLEEIDSPFREPFI